MCAMTDVAPGVAFDLSVNLESKAFIGSILEAEVINKLDFTLDKREATDGTGGSWVKESSFTEGQTLRWQRTRLCCPPGLWGHHWVEET